MKLKDPFVIILIGPVLSGKSTWIKNNYPNVNVISRDEIVMEIAGTRDYNKAFKIVNHKLVDKVLAQRFIDANLSKTSTIVDMINMRVKRRTKTLRYFDNDFYKLGVKFPILSDDEYNKRNIYRNINENKWISPVVITSMIDSYQEPTTDEGFNDIIFL